MVSGVPQGSAELFSIAESKHTCYAGDSTLVTIVPSPGERVSVSESMNLDLNRVSVWCDLRGMLLNASKSKTMIVVVVVGQTVGSISSKTLAYDCLHTLELCTASLIATS